MHVLHLASEKTQLRLVLPRAHKFIRVAFDGVAAASITAASKNLKDMKLGVYSSDAETRTPDRVGSGFEPVP